MMRVLQMLLEYQKAAQKNNITQPKKNNTQQKIMDAIGGEPVSIDEIVEITGIPKGTVQNNILKIRHELKIIDNGKHRPRLYYK